MTRHGHIALAVGSAMIGLLLIFLHIDKKPEPVVVKLPAGPAQPRLSAGEAGLDPAALEAAVAYAGQRHTSALVVVRAGHIVFEKYWNGTTIDTLVAPGFDPALAALAVGSALDDRLIGSLDMPLSNYLPATAGIDGAITTRELLARDHAELSLTQSVDAVALLLEQVTRQPYEQLVAARIWQPLGGGDLEFQRADSELRPKGVNASCCVRTRVGDWMRIGELLATEGNFAGGQVLLPHYVSQMLRPAHKEAPNGYFTRVDGAFAAHDVAWLEGTDKQRLWVVPSLKLAILRVGDEPGASEGWDEAMIPDSIIRGTSGWQPPEVSKEVDPSKYAPH
jgi:CubicO group peptidase (beta-lactamase class C family)